MDFIVVYSEKDRAGINIINELKKQFIPHIPIISIKKEIIYPEEILKTKEYLNADAIIFASKHSSKVHMKTLSVHAPGNWRNADFGGKNSKVSLTSAYLLKYLFQNLIKNSNALKEKKLLNPDYQITLEATHHGPSFDSLDKPCCFIEVGSHDLEWSDTQAAKVIATTIFELEKFSKNEFKKTIPVIAIGGPHYCPNFNKIQENNLSGYAISHIIPMYSMPFTKNIILEALEKTQEPVNTAVLDWKGCGNSAERNSLLGILNSLGIKPIRTNNITKDF